MFWGCLIFSVTVMSCNSNWWQQMRCCSPPTSEHEVRSRCCHMFFINIRGSAKFNFAHSTVHLSRICAPLWNAVWQPGWRGCVGFMAEGACGRCSPSLVVSSVESKNRDHSERIVFTPSRARAILEASASVSWKHQGHFTLSKLIK